MLTLVMAILFMCYDETFWIGLVLFLFWALGD